MLKLVGKKVGMSHKFEQNGSIVPLTFIKLYDNVVVDFKELDQDHNKIKIGFGKVEKKNKVKKSVQGIFLKNNLEVHSKLLESKIKKDSQFSVGNSLNVNDILKTGDIIDITGTTIGKGFAGVMKRWNFRGLEATHGVSISHRSHGSTGQRQDPGKVFKGKKMAGHLGVEKVTIRNLEVIYTDIEKSVIAVKGAVPGFSGADIIVKINKI